MKRRFFDCLQSMRRFRDAHIMWMMVLCMPFCCVVISGVLAQAFEEFKFVYLPLNILLYWTMFGVVYLVTGRVSWSLDITVAANTLFCVAEHYVYLFRGRHLSTSDLMSIKAAAAVADRYDYTPDSAIVLAVFSTLALFYFFYEAKKAAGTDRLGDTPKRKVFLRITLAPLSVLVFSFFAWGPFGLPVQQFYQSGPGVLLNTILGIPYIGIDMPSGYDSTMSERIENLSGIQGVSDEELPENIIIIMNESFADVSTLPYWKDYITDNDPYDRLHALMQRDNVTSGYTMVPVYGGNTAVSEWECLTGLSYNGVSDQVVPFISHMTESTPSLAKTAKASGYTCLSVHAYSDRGWNRRNAYASLGFDEQYYDADFPEDAEHIRSFLSDRADYEFLERLTESTDGKVFIHNVTMQNHKTDISGSYGDDVEDESLSVSVPVSLNSKDNWLDDYCMLIDESVTALEELFAYYDRCPEKTVILFFGDHWPKFEFDVYATLLGYDSSSEITLEEYSMMCRTPFMVYKNYGDADGKHDVMTGANFLGTFLLEASGLSAGPFWQYLTDLSSEIGAINRYCLQSVDGDIYPATGDVPDVFADAYAGYLSVIYDYIKE